MKSHFAIISTLILASCGPNQQEKEEIATIACNIMGESRNMDSAMRIREVNTAREEIGEKRFLGADKAIKEAFEYDLCKELVLNDPTYNMKLLEAIETEAKELEKIRIAEKEREEAERIARQEREEAERIACLRSQEEFTNSILSVFKDYPPSLSSGTITRSDLDVGDLFILSPYYYVEYGCLNSNGLDLQVTIQFEGNLGVIEEFASTSRCSDGRGRRSFSQSDLSGELLDLYEESLSAFFAKVERITVEWNGSIYLSSYEDNFSSNREAEEIVAKVDRKNFEGVDPDLTKLPHLWVVYER